MLDFAYQYIILDGVGKLTGAVVGSVAKGAGKSAGAEAVEGGAAAEAKMFSKEKQALVEMAKGDKRTGMTTADMEAYKQLNQQLPDPFPSSQVRGPESHPTRGAPTSQQPHGHVGPVDHIPIRDPEP